MKDSVKDSVNDSVKDSVNDSVNDSVKDSGKYLANDISNGNNLSFFFAAVDELLFHVLVGAVSLANHHSDGVAEDRSSQVFHTLFITHSQK